MKPKPWYRKKKVWGVLAAAALPFVGPALGAAWTETVASMIALLTGVVTEGVIDASSSMLRSVRLLRGAAEDALD